MSKLFPILTLVLGLAVGSSVAVAYANGGIDMFADVLIDGTLTVQDGTEGFGKVFTSDGSGTGSWQAPVDIDTNAGTICAANEYLDGDGTCKPIPNQEVTGLCSQGSFVVGVNPDGSVICQSLSFYVVSFTSTNTDNTIVGCDSGDVAVGGGGFGSNNNDLRGSRPISGVWQAISNGFGVTAYAVCLDNFPPHIP